MTATNFPKAHARVLVHEGGYANHKKDPGGVTLNGVIQRTYDAYRDSQGKPRRELRRSMLGDPEWNRERDYIYRQQYWDAVRGDEMPPGVDYAMYDAAVMSGPKQAIKWLQRALGIKVDGVIGLSTMSAVNNCKDYDVLVAGICDRRLAFCRQLNTWPTFGAGWSQRIANVKKVGQMWATGSVGAAPAATFVDMGEAKAEIEDAKQPPSPAAADLSTGGGVGIGGIGGLLESARTSLEPYVGSSEVLTKIVLALVLAGLVISIGSLIYGFYARYKRRKALDVLDLHAAAVVT